MGISQDDFSLEDAYMLDSSPSFDKAISRAKCELKERIFDARNDDDEIKKCFFKMQGIVMIENIIKKEIKQSSYKKNKQ